MGGRQKSTTICDTKRDAFILFSLANKNCSINFAGRQKFNKRYFWHLNSSVGLLAWLLATNSNFGIWTKQYDMAADDTNMMRDNRWSAYGWVYSSEYIGIYSRIYYSSWTINKVLIDKWLLQSSEIFKMQFNSDDKFDAFLPKPSFRAVFNKADDRWLLAKWGVNSHT